MLIRSTFGTFKPIKRDLDDEDLDWLNIIRE